MIVPVRTASSCEELPAWRGAFRPTARVWSHSDLAEYTAARSLISAADISKQHKNVGAVPPPYFSSFPSRGWNRPGLANRSAHEVSKEQV